MTAGPTQGDPFAFDFGLDFRSAADRVRGERERRMELVARQLPYNVPFLDDCLRSILPRDLILLGAPSGVGKTELAQSIAMSNALAGRRAHYFALEAEPDELERRTKFKLLAQMAFAAGRSLDGFNYADWYRGYCDDLVADLEEEAEYEMERLLGGFHTFYRGHQFGHDDVRRLFLAIQSETDLIVLDHLHYVDTDDGENENSEQKRIMKMIRDTSLGMGIPVICVVHLKKKDPREKVLIPDLDRIHGSSDLFKIATHSIMIAPARAPDLPQKGPAFANTFMGVIKDRMSGATPYVAFCRFDHRFRKYEPHYTLGRAAGMGDRFESLDLAEVPRWAKNHRPLFTPRIAGETV